MKGPDANRAIPWGGSDIIFVFHEDNLWDLGGMAFVSSEKLSLLGRPDTDKGITIGFRYKYKEVVIGVD